MKAVIGDIHGNLEALNAVCKEIAELPILCLGDVACHGPDSAECVRRSAVWEYVVAGQFDVAILDHNPSEWSAELNEFLRYSRKKFESAYDSELLFEILASYGTEFSKDGCFFFHGAPGDVRDYIFPEHIYTDKLDQYLQSSEHVFIGAGSHIPGIFRHTNDRWEFIEPENGKRYELPENETTVITIGSVGQPRDTDPRAAYAFLDKTSIVFHRVDYDMELTRNKIRNDPDIDDIQGDRLPRGY